MAFEGLNHGSPSPSPSSAERRPRKEVAKHEKATLIRRAVWLLQQTPEGMCGGLLTQKLKENDMDLITKVYGNTGEIQRGWLQDLVRRIPEVQKKPMGRDTWYSCSPEHLRDDADDLVSPSRCNSGSSLRKGSPASPERIVMETPARSDLANAVRDLLLKAPGGMSSSALGLQLRRSEPKAVEAFYANAGVGEYPAIQDLVRTIPGVIIQTKGASEFYSIDKSVAFESLFGDDNSSQGSASPLAAFAQWANDFAARMCSRRAKRP